VSRAKLLLFFGCEKLDHIFSGHDWVALDFTKVSPRSYACQESTSVIYLNQSENSARCNGTPLTEDFYARRD
jgi:hypothetical protein